MSVSGGSSGVSKSVGVSDPYIFSLIHHVEADLQSMLRDMSHAITHNQQPAHNQNALRAMYDSYQGLEQRTDALMMYLSDCEHKLSVESSEVKLTSDQLKSLQQLVQPAEQTASTTTQQQTQPHPARISHNIHSAALRMQYGNMVELRKSHTDQSASLPSSTAPLPSTARHNNDTPTSAAGITSPRTSSPNVSPMQQHTPLSSSQQILTPTPVPVLSPHTPSPSSPATSQPQEIGAPPSGTSSMEEAATNPAQMMEQ